MPSPSHYRTLLAVVGLTYLIWWVAVEIALPSAYNPVGSRLAVVFYCWGLSGLSFKVERVRRNLDIALYSSLWILTLHYFYLFYANQADINWVVGTYVTVIAACACFQTTLALAAFAVWVLALSLLISYEDPQLLRTIYLPGVVTTLSFAYLGLRSRLGSLARSRETSQRFQKLFEGVFEGILVHDEFKAIDANDAFAEIFGYRREEIIGIDLTKLTVPEDVDRVPERVKSFERPYEAVGLRKDGSRVDLEVRGKQLMFDGQMVRMAAIRDITERKKHEQDRIRAESSERAIRLRDEFLSIASHELKTPLTNIKLQTQLILRGIKKGDAKALEPAQFLKFIDLTDRQADRLTRLVEEMLDVSRISAGKLSFEWEVFDADPIVRDVAATFEGTLEQSGSTLRIETVATAPVRSDRHRFEQVIRNLLSNAIKYGNRKPIEIRIDQRDNEVRITFTDQGIGIPVDVQERIFQRFERAISSRKISGLGLGLYISKTIVDASGGRIEVESQPERGSCFTVVIPAAGGTP